MNHKDMKEEKLISFLYGEISDEERREVEEYLRENPAKQQEMEELGRLRGFMSGYMDLDNVQKPVVPFVKEVYAMKYWAIAATIAFLLSVGWSIYNMNFKSMKVETPVANEEDGKIESLLQQQEQLAIINKVLIDKISHLEELIMKVDDDQQNQKMLISDLQKKNNEKNNSNEQVDKYLVALQQQNKEILNDFLVTSQAAQREQLQTILIDFAGYMDEQREQDLRFLQVRIENLEQNTGEFQQATAQLMANLTNSEIQYQNQ